MEKETDVKIMKEIVYVIVNTINLVVQGTPFVEDEIIVSFFMINSYIAI